MSINVINGTSGADSLVGTADADKILGGGGNDMVVGGLGNDELWGGTGDDRLFGGADNDTLQGEGGNDYIEGGTGDDTLFGGAGRDNLFGGAGSDTLISGGGGIDFLSGGADADTFIVQAGQTGGNLSFYGNRAVDQWVRIHDLDFCDSDRLGLHGGPGTGGASFVELAGSGVSAPWIDSMEEWMQLGQYLQAQNPDSVVENTQQGSLSFLLTDAWGQVTAIEFLGYSLSDLV